MKASSHWATASELQSTVASWNQTADTLDANAKQLVLLRDQIAQIVLSQRTLLQTWSVTTQHVLSSVDILAGGDVETLQSFGFPPVVRGSSAPIAVPADIMSVLGRLSGQAFVRWDEGAPERRHGYVVQHASDAANAATYSVPAVSTKRSYVLSGASASVMQFRVAAIDPTSSSGQSAWSSWVAVTLR